MRPLGRGLDGSPGRVGAPAFRDRLPQRELVPGRSPDRLRGGGGSVWRCERNPGCKRRWNARALGGAGWGAALLGSKRPPDCLHGDRSRRGATHTGRASRRNRTTPTRSGHVADLGLARKPACVSVRAAGRSAGGRHCIRTVRRRRPRGTSPGGCAGRRRRCRSLFRDHWRGVVAACARARVRRFGRDLRRRRRRTRPQARRSYGETARDQQPRLVRERASAGVYGDDPAKRSRDLHGRSRRFGRTAADPQRRQ